MWHQETHHSTALEGNTLTVREVTALLDHGRALGVKSLQEYNEISGYANAARWVYAQALEPDAWHDVRLLTLNEVRHIHHVAMTLVWDVTVHKGATDREGPGNFREHDIRAFAGGMKPPTWLLVPAQMEHWLQQVQTVSEQVAHNNAFPQPLSERIARLHNEFQRIHPFIDGNGRTRRLILNLILVRLGYPPIIILKRQRNQYLSALQKADAGDYGALGELIARAMYDNLIRFIMPSLTDAASLVSLAALAGEKLSLAALQQAAQRGRLEAIQTADGTCLSSRQAVAEYRKSKYH